MNEESKPSVKRQKVFIITYGDLLDHDSRCAILSVIMTNNLEKVILENDTSKEVSINMDAIINNEIILQIYNIVRNRREYLNKQALNGQTKKK